VANRNAGFETRDQPQLVIGSTCPAEYPPDHYHWFREMETGSSEKLGRHSPPQLSGASIQRKIAANWRRQSRTQGTWNILARCLIERVMSQRTEQRPERVPDIRRLTASLFVTRIHPLDVERCTS